MKKNVPKLRSNYYSFNSYLRRKFGCRVHRLSLNAGFLCPNLDGTLSSKGCIFCNNKAFSPFVGKNSLPLEEQVRESIARVRKRFGARKYIAYFQSFSNTYAGTEELKVKYEVVRKFPDIVGIAISTRPDCVDKKKIEMIKSFSCDYEVYLEYGLQSTHERTLELINRNHTLKDFCSALRLANEAGIRVGAHVILGLPGESKEDMMLTAGRISRMDLWGIKFHCLHVVKDTALAGMYSSRPGRPRLLSASEYVDILVDFLARIPSHWIILRLISDATRDDLIAPLWINEKQRILQMVDEKMRERDLWQGKLFEENIGRPPG